MKELLEDIKLSKISYLVEKLEKRNFNEKIKTFKKLEKKKITKKVGLYLIENSTRNFEVVDEFGGINSSLIELCFKNYYNEYNSAIEKIFKDLPDKAQDRVLYLLTTISDKNTLELYTNLVLKYYKEKENIPIGELINKPLSYPYLFPDLFKALKFKIEKNNVLILLNHYLNSGVVLKEDLKKNKKLVTDNICNLFEKALTYKFKNTYNALNNKEYKDLRYYLEIAVNIEYYISGTKTKSYLTKLLKKNDNQLKLFILDNYLRKNQKLTKFNFDPIEKDPASKYALIELLTIYNKLDLIPKKYLDKKSIAQSDLYTNFVITTNYTNEPKKIKFIKKYIKDNYDYYIFKFDCTYTYNSNTNDYLTNYICNQVGISKYNGEKVTNKFIGISGGYNNNDLIIKKNHKKLLIEKIDNENEIDSKIESLLKEPVITQIPEDNLNKKNKTKKIKNSKNKNKLKNKEKKLKEKKQFKFPFKFPFKFNSKDKKLIDDNTESIKKKSNHIFTYILLFLFATFICLLIYCMLYIYGVASISDGIDQNVIKPTKLDDKGNFTEIMGTEIFNQTENEYFVLLFKGAKKEKTKYYRYINEYNKRNYRFYYVDLDNNENKFLYGPNEIDFVLLTDRLLHVKDKEYDYYVDGKTNILNEMQSQIEQIIQAEKEKKKTALKEEEKKKIKSIVISMVDDKKDEQPLTKTLLRVAKRKKDNNKYALKYPSSIDFNIINISNVIDDEKPDEIKQEKIIVKLDNKKKKKKDNITNINKIKNFIIKNKTNIYKLKTTNKLTLK